MLTNTNQGPRNVAFSMVGLLIAALGFSSSAAAADIYLENFDNPDFLKSVFIPAGDTYGHNDRIGWANTGIGYINNAEGWTFADGVYLALHPGTSDQALWLNEIGPGATKTISGLTTGQNYEVSFLQWGDDFYGDFAYGFSFTGKLDIDGKTILSYDYTDKPWGTAEPITRTAFFTATDTTAAMVFSASSGGASPIIDSIRVSSVPLPSTALLIAPAALGGLSFRRRRVA